MKQVFLIPMSINEKENEEIINEAIQKIGKDHTVTWITELIKPLYHNKFMLICDKDDAVGSDTPTIGVKVIRGSYDMKETEDIINETLLEMDTDGDKTFISISNPVEYMYIILFEYKAGKNPRIKLVPNPIDSYMGSRKLTSLFQDLDEDKKWELEPYDSIVIGENHEKMIILFSKA